MIARHSTGVAGLDRMLGGGLIPGTLTVLVGATGIGKTQLAVSYAAEGRAGEGRPGIILDLASRGDPQNHADYARRLAGWNLSAVVQGEPPPWNQFFARADKQGDYLGVFAGSGRRVTRHDLSPEEWQDWQAEFARQLSALIGFCYGNFVTGTRRVVLDGMEPVERPSDSIQGELVEYVYQQILRKDAGWLARDLFRQAYRQVADEVAARTYPPAEISCLLAVTSRETLLTDLIARPIDEGDLLVNANTVIYLGKVPRGSRILRAAYVAKHRGSECSDEVVPYSIHADGLRMDSVS